MDRFLVMLCHVAVLLVLCLLSTPGAFAEESPEQSNSNDTTTVTQINLGVTQTSTAKPNATHVNETGSLNGTWREAFDKNKDMITRAIYVIIGVSAFVILYFVVRAWRSKRRRNKSRKYGLITSDTVEMEPLDRDVDDDDDMTVFERNSRFK